MKRLSSLLQKDYPVRRFCSLVLIGLVFIMCLALIGCGGGSGNSDSNIVKVSPGEVTLTPNATQQFTVTGLSNTDVTWSVEPQTGGGSITTGGLYTAPIAFGTFYVVATSKADSTKFGKAKVIVGTGGGGGGHYYEGTITIERIGLASNQMNYNEGATITNFKLIDGGNGYWVLVQGSPSKVTAHVANKDEDTGARVDYPLTTKDSMKTSILLTINSNSNTYQLMVVPYAEGAIITPASGPAQSMDWPIAVAPIKDQPLPADPSRITGTITQTQIANCTVTWDLVKKINKE